MNELISIPKNCKNSRTYSCARHIQNYRKYVGQYQILGYAWRCVVFKKNVKKYTAVHSMLPTSVLADHALSKHIRMEMFCLLQ